jgi:hypothetical protein
MKRFLIVTFTLVLLLTSACKQNPNNQTTQPPNQGLTFNGPFLNVDVPEGWTANTLIDHEGKNNLQLQDGTKQITFTVSPLGLDPNSDAEGELMLRLADSEGSGIYVSDVMEVSIDSVPFKYYVSQSSEEDLPITQMIGTVSEIPFLIILIGADVDEEIIKSIIATIDFTLED